MVKTEKSTATEETKTEKSTATEKATTIEEITTPYTSPTLSGNNVGLDKVYFFKMEKWFGWQCMMLSIIEFNIFTCSWYIAKQDFD